MNDQQAIAKHVAFLNAEFAAVSLVATLPSGKTVEVFKDGRVIPSKAA